MESDSKKFSGIETLMDYLDCADSYVSGISRTEMAFAQIGHFILSFRHHLETLTDKPNFHTPRQVKDLLLMLGNVARRIHVDADTFKKIMDTLVESEQVKIIKARKSTCYKLI